MRNTRTSPKSLSQTIRPAPGIWISETGCKPVLSGLTRRFAFNRVKKCQPSPRHKRKFSQEAYQLSKQTYFGRKSAIMRLKKHLGKMIVLGFTISVFSKNSIITRRRTITVSPKQSNQIEPGNDFAVFTGIMPINQIISFRIRFIKSRIIQNKDALIDVNLRSGFLPERFGIRFKPGKQASKSIRLWSAATFRLTGCRFSCRDLSRSGNNKINVINIRTFWRIHALFLSNICSTA